MAQGYEQFEKLRFDMHVAMKLKEAEDEAAAISERFTHDEVMNELCASLKKSAEGKHE